MLRNRWYPVLEASRLLKKPFGIKRFGLEWVLWRDLQGVPQALPAACPHRGASLAGGRVLDGQIECPWHGFRFEGSGRCTELPCEGPEARIPSALHLTPPPLREENELIWMWWGEAQTKYPKIPFFDDVEAFAGTTETSYILPFHYSRMVETNLDIHHTPFVHGNVIPVEKRMLDFDAHVEGDRIYSSGILAKDTGTPSTKSTHSQSADQTNTTKKQKGMPFRADLILPNLGLVVLTEKLHLIICATPVDDTHSWMWFRYRQSYTRNAVLGKLITWISVQSELRIVQKQDWRLFQKMTSGTIDDFPYAFVHSDKAIALYRRLRAKELSGDREIAKERESATLAQPKRMHSAN